MSVDDLDDVAVLAALQELTAELREALPADQREAVSSQEEAQLALAAVLDPGNAESVAERLQADPRQAAAAARDLLTAAVQDPETAESAARLVENPPAEDQMAVLSGLEVVIVVAALITLLQTKVRIHVERKDGRVTYKLDVEKEAAQNSLIEKVISLITEFFSR